jgi:integrase
MAKDLTIKAIDSFEPGTARREIPDGHTRGLFYVLQPSGAASWAVRYRFGGKPKKLTIGPYPAIDLRAAREMAGDAIKVVAKGEDPAAAKQVAKAAARTPRAPDLDIIEKVVETFIERYAKKHTREKSHVETKRILDREVVEAWRGRRLSKIGRAEIAELLDSIVDRGAPIMANRTFAALRKMCAWAVGRGIITSSPCDKVDAPAPEHDRERVLTDSEISEVWKASDAAAWPFGRMSQLLLLTGQRLREVAHATWGEFDLPSKIWTIPAERTKNGVAHEVPLSPEAIAILAVLPRIKPAKGAPHFAFTTTGKTPISGFSNAKEAFDAAILGARRKAAIAVGDEPEEVKAPERWTYHDLRRTADTGMNALGFAPHVVDAVLNHLTGSIKGVTRTYNRYDYRDEKRAALLAWGRYLDALVTCGETWRHHLSELLKEENTKHRVRFISAIVKGGDAWKRYLSGVVSGAPTGNVVELAIARG